MRAARDGERQAVRELVATIHPLVHRWCLARTGDPSEAQDLGQDVLIDVVRGISSFKGEASFRTWLYRVVQNRAHSRERARRVQETLVEDGRGQFAGEGGEDRARAGVSHGPSPAGATSRSIAHALDRDRLLERVRESLSSLSARQREVFFLVDLEGWSGREAAEAMGVAPSTARVFLLRARRAIRKEILRTDPELVEAFFE